MKHIIFGLFVASILFACKKEKDHDHDHDHDEVDTTTPVLTINSPMDSTIYHIGDTVHMMGLVTDNDLHQGTIKIINDSTAFEYYANYPYVHATTSAIIDFDYIVTGVTQNSAVTLSFHFEDHAANTATIYRKLIFMP